MCGINGLILSEQADSQNVDRFEHINRRLRHRGPDANEVWISDDRRVALGHTRLAIIDLSEGGRQPKYSQNSRYVVSFNGEIYNYRELRQELEDAGARFNTESDTEVLVELVAAAGFEAAVRKLDGMFAISVWDKHARVLHLARDRVGEKPLYYTILEDGSFAFSSEMRGLLGLRGFRRELDSDALNLYMRHGYIHAPRSIFRSTWKLVPGGMLTVRADQPSEVPRVERYWDPFEQQLKQFENPFTGSYEEAVDELDRLLTSSVRLRMISDVPLGSFLSGGVDSSVVTSLMQETSSQPVRTFTIGFGEKEFDESTHARNVAEHLGTNHTELRATADDALNLVQSLPEVYSEPLSDSSQLPTLLVSQLARQHITVVLSGDGGDELFSGYMQYPWLQSLWRTSSFMPYAFRRAVFGALSRVPYSIWRLPLKLTQPLLPSRLHGRQGAYRLQRLFNIASSRSIGLAHRELVSDCRRPERYLLNSEDPGDYFSAEHLHNERLSVPQQLSLLDFAQYLPGDLLAKLDRASMSVALETRVPILDHKIAEFAWSLPDAYKLHQGKGKRILREVLYRRVPAELIDRPKMGFRVPVRDWLGGSLRHWVDDMLSRDSLTAGGVFNADAVASAWQAHRSGKANLEHRLWSILMFQSWSQWVESQSVEAP